VDRLPEARIRSFERRAGTMYFSLFVRQSNKAGGASSLDGMMFRGQYSIGRVAKCNLQRPQVAIRAGERN
jgi:hypothetical protein